MPNIFRRNKISFEYIRGLIDGEGCFSFCTIGLGDSKNDKKRLPAFIFSMNKRDKNLLFQIKEKLGLSNKVYEYPQNRRKGGYNRQPMTMIIVRDLGQIKNIIVPLCYKKLVGYKAEQFDVWIEKIGSDPRVPMPYKLISRLYKSGFYDKNFLFND